MQRIEDFVQHVLRSLRRNARWYGRRPSALRARRWARRLRPGRSRRSAPAPPRWPRSRAGSAACRRCCRPRATSQSARLAPCRRRGACASPSSPCVISSPGACASAILPASTLMPGTMPWRAASSGSGTPSSARWPSVSSYRMTPLMKVAEPGRREQQTAIGAPVLLGRLHADRLETLGDRRAALVGSQDALAGLDQRLDCGFEFARSGHGVLSIQEGQSPAARRFDASAPVGRDAKCRTSGHMGSLRGQRSKYRADSTPSIEAMSASTASLTALSTSTSV